MPHTASATSPGSTVLRPGPLPPAATSVVASIGVLLSLTFVVGVIRGLTLEDLWYDGFFLIVAVGHAALGTMIVRRLRTNPVGWLLLAAAMAAAAALLALALQGTGIEAAIEWLPLVPVVLLPLPLLVFPDGPVEREWWSVVWWATLGTAIVATVALAVGTWIDPVPVAEWVGDDGTLRSDLSPSADPWIATAVVGTLLVQLLAVGGGAAALAVRRRTATDLERGQIRILLYGLAVVPPAVLLESRVVGMLVVAALSVPVTMTVAIVARGMYDIDLFINRSIVYAVLTVVVFAAYSVTVTALERVLSGAGAATFVSTGVVAATFVAVREQVQQMVNRMLYGHRNEPYAVLTKLRQKLQAVLDPDSVLPGMADTIMTALRVPYVEIRVRRDGALQTAVSVGRLVADTVPYAMWHDGVVVGEVRVAPRAPDEELTDAEDRLLADLAAQAAPAVSAVVAIQRLRERD